MNAKEKLRIQVVEYRENNDVTGEQEEILNDIEKHIDNDNPVKALQCMKTLKKT